MNEQLATIAAESEKVLSFLESLEAVARQKLAEKSDEQAVHEIIATAWYQ